jgi:hypothetical protein
MKYKIEIVRHLEDRWENWAGSDRDIKAAIIDSLRESTNVIEHDSHIETNEILIDFTDDNGIVIADFIQLTQGQTNEIPG